MWPLRLDWKPLAIAGLPSIRLSLTLGAVPSTAGDGLHPTWFDAAVAHDESVGPFVAIVSLLGDVGVGFGLERSSASSSASRSAGITTLAEGSWQESK